jgi:hypothetical protein
MQDTLTIPERDSEHERVLGIVFELSPAQASVLSCLVRGTIATKEQLLTYSGTRPPIKIVVSRARAKLRTHGLDIKSRIGVGYWIEKDDRKGIEKAVREFLEHK